MKFKIILFLCISFFSCNKKSQWDVALSSEKLDFEIHHFEKDFYRSENKIAELRSKYPLFLTPNVPDSIYLKKQSDSLELELFKSSEILLKEQYISDELESIFKHIKHYYPNFNPPKVYTYISGIDYNFPVLYKDGFLMIASDCFLGKNYPAYQHIPAYLRHTYAPEYLGSKVVDALAPSFIRNDNHDFKLVSEFIYTGKNLLLKDALLPSKADSIKTLYPNSKLEFTKNNEFMIWNYFVENDLLFQTNNKLKDRFLKVAPFSKFYLDIDSQTPGQIGKWIGWQIISKYFDKNNLTLPEILSKENAKEIFKNSKYKPKK